ncbi:concanavalin A-like lectin/glucanase domain-containing protein [Podospora aff. communis PSN243]|uniref:Concanavalin A-like lectin/glucanase domain-containing protein n=1 Tax=Podospora aff. communis PSN243 TaxID=3040156 RepID=A0AAV9GUE5_9PEZI|nr:concanavalin A-like lectin/glucanase domain-containing protein [Podospora aff. communis PSN243]
MRCLSGAVVFLALAVRWVAGLDIAVSGTQDGVPLPAEELTFSEFEDGVIGLLDFRPSGTVGGEGGNRVAAAVAANPTAASNNWCGSINKTPATNRIKSITATWQHPNCRVQTDKELRQAISPWVGMTNGTAPIQAGSYCQVKNWAGKVDHFVWWQWFGHGTQIMNDFPVDPGDQMQATITMPTPTSAVIYLANFSKGRSLTFDLKNGNEIIGTEAVWVAEAPILNGFQAIYPRYDSIWFQRASATREDGSNLGIIGATQWQVRNQCRSWEYDDETLELIQIWENASRR